MDGRLVPALLAMTMLSGCFGGDAPSAAPAATADDAPPLANETAAAPEAAAPPGAPAAEEPSMTVVAIAHEGRVATSAFACVGGPVGECPGYAVGEGDSDVVLADFAGRVSGGALRLEWTPATPASARLSFGIMLMGGGEACGGLELATVRGASPLTIEVPEAERPLCPEEVVHVWVSGDHWGGDDPVYYQVDVEQAFTLTGEVQIEA